MLLSELIAVSGHFESAYQVGSDRHHSRIDVRRALSKLTPAQQRLSVMLGVHGLSIKEAAEQLRIPRSTLYEEIKRIRQVCWRRSKSEPPRRPNFEPGVEADFERVGCG